MSESLNEWIQVKAKLADIRLLKELLEIKSNSINANNQTHVDDNKVDNNECVQMAAGIHDVRFFLEKNKVKDFSRWLCRVYFSSNKEYIFFICNLNICKIEELKDLRVYGFWGRYLNNAEPTADYFFMELGVKLNCRDTPIEIKKINAGQNKRRGRGSLGIKFLEDVLIPDINEILKLYGHSENIGYIYGISADLCDDTNALARAKFYCRNGFTMINSHFYKTLNK
jgi:hypothetical protein